MAIIDISVPLHNGVVVWPSDPPFHIERRRTIEKDGANVSDVSLSTHTGTHVDPPIHFVPGGATEDQMSLDVLIGPADVIDLPTVSRVTAADLERAGVPADCRRLLLRTRNSRYWEAGDMTFHQDYVALDADGAQWIVDRGIGLVGIDYLSIEPYKMPGHPVHKTLLQASVISLETIDLSRVTPGRYQLICLPLLLQGADGGPARAVLVR